ncbi:putative leader peptide [Streptomyces sp. LZ34]
MLREAVKKPVDGGSWHRDPPEVPAAGPNWWSDDCADFWPRVPCNRDAGAAPRPPGWKAEVTVVRPVCCPPAPILAPRGCVLLYSRPHIDLKRVAGALCCP